MLDQALLQLPLTPAFGRTDEIEQVRIAGRLLSEIG
jgi:hypothetical protein